MGRSRNEIGEGGLERIMSRDVSYLAYLLLRTEKSQEKILDL
jgi:hypothetical protein